jgi:hypothetical protein
MRIARREARGELADEREAGHWIDPSDDGEAIAVSGGGADEPFEDTFEDDGSADPEELTAEQLRDDHAVDHR